MDRTAARLAAAIGLALVAGAAAHAQADAVQPGTASCELHAWPGNSLRSTYHGWIHGGINDGAVQGRDGYKRLPPDPLSTRVQAEVLRSGALDQMLSLPGYKVIVHDTALSSAEIRRSKGRILKDAPPCYAELLTDDVFFQQDVIDGRFLKVLFRFRGFEGTDEPTRVFGTYSQRKLTLFPPKTEAEEAASFTELEDQYHEAIVEFGAALNKPPKDKSKRSGRNRD